MDQFECVRNINQCDFVFQKEKKEISKTKMMSRMMMKVTTMRMKMKSQDWKLVSLLYKKNITQFIDALTFVAVYNDNLADDDDSGQDWNEIDEQEDDEEIDSEGNDRI